MLIEKESVESLLKKRIKELEDINILLMNAVLNIANYEIEEDELDNEDCFYNAFSYSKEICKSTLKKI